MREITVGPNDAGQRLDRFVAKAVPALPPALLQKYIRLKRIKVDGRGAKRDTRLDAGSVLRLYINDEFFGKPKDRPLDRIRPDLRIVYEDERVLLADKRPGMLVHADGEGWGSTLIDQIQAYLYRKGEWDPAAENAFAPALCNRIDRNTGGIVIAAKDAEALRAMDEKIRAREVEKSYLCVALGTLRPREGEIRGFLRKDGDRGVVTFHRRPVPGGRTAVTRYRVLETRGELSLVECGLVTGRTHQIRASMAAAGHPLLGDGKYGDGAANRRYGETRQALYAYKVRFAFAGDEGPLGYLRGREVRVGRVPFQEKYFPRRP